MRFWFWVLCGGLACAQEDFLPPGYEEASSFTFGSLGAKEKCGEGGNLRVLFKCVEYYKCEGRTDTIGRNEEVDKDGQWLIDTGTGPQDKDDSCSGAGCKIPSGPAPSTPPAPTEIPEPRPTPPPVLGNCGIHNPEGIGSRLTGYSNEAQYGEFPWLVAVLQGDVYQCDGTLIHPKVVVTAAHCVASKMKFKVRAGEWDTRTKSELYPHQERDVESVVVHKQYNAGGLYNDIALLFLSTPVELAENVGVACLPPRGAVFNQQYCIVSGWDKDVFGKQGPYQVIIKKIHLLTVARGPCQEALRKTRLGEFFQLHESFICARGLEEEDTCAGDGGSPLVCPIPRGHGRYQLAGIVVSGMGCEMVDGTPGIYVDVALFRDWIDQQLKLRNVDTTSYQY